MELTTTSYIRETSPHRHELRNGVRRSIITNAEKMKEKHSKRKRIRVVNFSIGENVSVKVPEIDRDKSDPERVPGVVVSVTGSVQPKYQVLTAHGAIKDVFTSSYLSSCPGIVKTGNPDHYERQQDYTLYIKKKLHTASVEVDVETTNVITKRRRLSA